MKEVATPVKTVTEVSIIWAKNSHRKFDALCATAIAAAINGGERIHMLRENGRIYIVRWDPFMTNGDLEL